MTREQMVARLNMAFVAGVIDMTEWIKRLRQKEASVDLGNGVDVSEEDVLSLMNEMLEENNELTPSTLSIPSSSC